MKRIILLGLSLVLVLLLTLPTFSQDATPESTETSVQNARDYCAGQVSYTLPEGWAESAVMRNGASVAREIASSKPTLSKYASLLDPDESSVIIGVFDRKSFAASLNAAEDADISTLLRALLESPSSVQFTMSDVVTLTIGDSPAAQVSGYSDVEYQDAVFIAFDSETLGMVLLSANPAERTRWNSTALALAESLRPDVPRYPVVDGSLPLPQSFPTSDCSVVFGIPEGWTATQLSAAGASVFKAWLTNYDTPGEKSGNLLDDDQARLELQIIHADQVKGDLAYYSDPLNQHINGKIASQSKTTIGDQPGLLTEIPVSDGDKHIGDTLVIAVENRDGSITTLTLYAAPGELDRWRATALAVAASLQVQLPPSS